MDWSFLQPIAYLAALYGFVWSMRKDSKDDYLRLEKKLEVWRDESNKKFDLVYEEMKDFHGKMCAIEERRKKVIK
jgi:hypothetical protein